jgi:hypothetical protein
MIFYVHREVVGTGVYRETLRQCPRHEDAVAL